MSNQTIAIATGNKNPDIGGSMLVVDELKILGYSVSIQQWQDKAIDWARFDAVIVFWCWGYHEHIDEFYAWLERLDTSGIRVINNTNIIRWNAHKSYLFDLQSRGANIPQTQIFKQGNPQSLKEVIGKTIGKTQYVIKPCYGASATGAFLVSNETVDKYESQFQMLSANNDVLLQEFIQEIATGEISAIFINNKYSHSVIKVPKEQDFRSNYEYGGSANVIKQNNETKQLLTNIYTTCGVDTLYARLDVVVTPKAIVVMELELIEPYLYFEYDEGSAKQFAQAIMEKLLN